MFGYSYQQCQRCTGTCNCTTAATTGTYVVYSGTPFHSENPFLSERDIIAALRAAQARTNLMALTAPPPPVLVEPKSFTPPARPRPSSWLTKVARRRC
jgi:hypothetical protein